MATNYHIADETVLEQQMNRTDGFGGMATAPTVINAQHPVRQTIVEVRLDDIVEDSPFQTRRAFDPENDERDRALVDSLADTEIGQQEPVCLTLVAPGQYQVVYGHRRIAGLRYLKRVTVQAIVVRGNLLTLGTKHALENTGVSLSPIEQAELAQLFEERLQLTTKQIATRLGCKERYVQYLRVIIKAHPAVRKAVGDECIAAITAVAVGHAPMDHQPELAMLVIQHGLSEMVTKDIVEHMAAAGVGPTEAAVVILGHAGFASSTALETSDSQSKADEASLKMPTSRPRSTGQGAAKSKKKVQPAALTLETALAMLQRCAPGLSTQAARGLATRAVERNADPKVVRLAGLLSGSLKARALDTAEAISEELAIKPVLDALLAVERQADLIARERHIGETGNLLDGIARLATHLAQQTRQTVKT